MLSNVIIMSAGEDISTDDTQQLTKSVDKLTKKGYAVEDNSTTTGKKFTLLFVIDNSYCQFYDEYS